MLRDQECVTGDFLLMAAPHVLELVLPVEASTGYWGGRIVVPFPCLIVGLTITLRRKQHGKTLLQY